MKYTDLVFDLYGTLVDIHTEEDEGVWEKTALYFGFYGAHFSPSELASAFQKAMADRQAEAGQSYECFPDIPFQQVFAQLFRAKGVEEAETLAINAAQLFRIASIDYIRLYPGVKQALAQLRRAGFRLWLLSNAQQVFTAYELRHLELEDCFDGILLSSDYGCRKPDSRFYRALIEKYSLEPSRCLMIVNDRETDIAGGAEAGMDTLYLHTRLTPWHQPAADPGLHPDRAGRDAHRYEYEEEENWSWLELARHIEAL